MSIYPYSTGQEFWDLVDWFVKYTYLGLQNKRQLCVHYKMLVISYLYHEVPLVQIGIHYHLYISRYSHFL